MFKKRTRDCIINGTNSGMLVKDLEVRDDKTQYERMRVVEEICSNPYWADYTDDMLKVELSQSDPLSEDSAVTKNIDKMANYILYAEDGEKPRRQKYNFYKNEYQFKEKVKNVESLEANLEFRSETDREIDFLLGTQQYLIEKTFIYKKSMLKHGLCAEYQGGINFFENKENRKKVRVRLSSAKRRIEGIIEDLIEEKENLKPTDLRYSEIVVEIRTLTNITRSLSYKIKNIMYNFNYELKAIRDDVLQTYISEKRPIVFKHVINYMAEREEFNFFDTFDIVDDFGNPDILKLVLKIGGSKGMVNHMETILCTNGVFEERKAMVMLCELVNYYAMRASLDATEFKALIMYRKGKSFQHIGEQLGVSKQAFSLMVERIIKKLIAVHYKNTQDVYELNFIKDITPIKKCTVCEKWLSLENFAVDNSKKDGKKSACKECIKVKRK